MKNWMYPILVVFAASCYGILSTIIKLAMNAGFTASEAVSSQYIVGFFIVLLLFIVTQRKIPRISGVKTLLLAGSLTAITGTLYGQSIVYLPASLAVVMLFQFTWIGVLLDCVLRRRKPTRGEALSLVFLFAGTILAAGVIDADLSGIAWQGWAYGIAAALSFSLFIRINMRQIEGMNTTTRLFFVSFVAMLAISLFQNPEIVWNGQLFAEGLWIYGLALGTFGILLPIYLFTIAVPKVGGSMASILSAMELPVAVTVSVLVLSEPITFLQIVGIVIIIFGMILPSLLQRKRNYT